MPVKNDLHYAVVVGIGSYPGISDLKSPLRDAKDFCKWLVTDGGLPCRNVVRVRSSRQYDDVFAAQPTRTDVNNALRRVNSEMEKRVKSRPLDRSKTRLYLYVSGHGISPDGSEAALLMANAGRDAWGENIPCAAYLRRYEKCQFFGEVVIFADCCRLRQSAEFFGPPFDVDGNTNVMGVNSFLGFATQLGDAAYEPTDGASADQARSYFTQALLEGLKGSAADAVTGEINTVTLTNYTTGRVKALTADKRYPQVPKMQVDPARPIVFRSGNPGALLPGKPRHQITIDLPRRFIGDAVLEDARFLPVSTHTAGSGAWVVSLEDGFYQVRPIAERDGRSFQNQGLFGVLGEDKHVQL